MRTECTQNLTFLQDQLIMSWCQLHFFFHSVFFEAKFPAKMQHIQCAHTVHGKFGCGKSVSSFTFSITRLVCGDIEDHKGQLWRRNNEVCMAKWNYIKVNKKQNKKIISRKYKVWKTRSWYIHKRRTEQNNELRHWERFRASCILMLIWPWGKAAGNVAVEPLFGELHVETKLTFLIKETASMKH